MKIKNYTKTLGGLFTMAFLMVAAAGFGQAVKVDANGLVGIGHGNPLGQIHAINNNTGEHNRFWANDGVGNGSHQIAEFYRHAPGVGNAGFNAGYFANGTDVTSTYLYAPGARDFSIATFNGGIYYPLYMENTGNVGINNLLTPSQALDVNGSAHKNDGNSAWLFTSDMKSKRNVRKYKQGLDEILSMRPITWEYNGKVGTIDDGSKHIGLIAQEFQKIAPSYVKEAVYTPTTYTSSSEVDDLSSVRIQKSNSSETYLQMNDAPIKYMLINAVQEQQAIIDEQEDRIQALETMVQNLIDNQVNQNLTEVTLSATSSASLGQNAPNPFNTLSSIEYSIPSDAKSAQIVIANINGQVVKSVEINHIGQGALNVTSDNFPTGTYTYKLIVDNKDVMTKKMIINR